MSDYPHVQAAFINVIREEGTKNEACDWLQKEWNKSYALSCQLDDIEAENDRLRAKLAKAVEALKPFDRFATVIDEVEKSWGGEPSPDEKAIHGDLTVGHFRRAATTLKEITDEA